MPAPAAQLELAEWDPSGPALQSREDTRYATGRLGTDYLTNCDGRYDGELWLGPKANVVDLSAVGGTAANTNGLVRCRSLYADAEAAIVTRGTDYAAVRLSDFAVVDPAISLASRALSPLYTKNSAGTQEISICLAAATYRVITGIAGAWPTFTVTESACNEAITNQTIFDGWPSNVVFGGGGQVIRHNELTGATGMDASAWTTRGTVTGDGFTFTDGKTFGSFVVFGTTAGPYVMDNDFAEYRPLIPELGRDANNCKGMSVSTLLGGILCPTANGLWLLNETSAKSVGVERYTQNTSPVMGRVTAITPLEPPWLMVAINNPTNDDTTLCYARPSNSTDPFEFPLVFYPVATLTDTPVEMLQDLGNVEGTRTNPTVALGYSSNMAWFTRGRIQREVDDANYVFGASGTWYGTELRRQGQAKKRVKWIELETAGCTASMTVQVGMSVDGRTSQNLTPAIKSNGVYRAVIDRGVDLEGRKLKPNITLTGSGGASPHVLGRLRIAYQLVEDEVSRGN